MNAWDWFMLGNFVLVIGVFVVWRWIEQRDRQRAAKAAEQLQQIDPQEFKIIADPGTTAEAINRYRRYR